MMICCTNILIDSTLYLGNYSHSLKVSEVHIYLSKKCKFWSSMVLEQIRRTFSKSVLIEYNLF